MNENITDRLRCRYALGPILADGEPEFGWRDFSGPAIEGMVLPTPLMLEAAEAIAAKDAEIAQLRQALKDCQTVAIMRGDQYLCDCIDNTGQRYQSAHLAALLEKK